MKVIMLNELPQRHLILL